MQRQGVCIAGYGETPYVRTKNKDRSPLQYIAKAIKLALNNSGLQKKDAQGLALISVTHPMTPPSLLSSWAWNSTGCCGPTPGARPR